MEQIAAGNAGAEKMAATKFILRIHDSISPLLLWKAGSIESQMVRNRDTQRKTFTVPLVQKGELMIGTELIYHIRWNAFLFSHH